MGTVTDLSCTNITAAVGDGKYRVTATLVLTEEGAVLLLFGGMKAHVGSVVLSIPRPGLRDPSVQSATSSVLNVPAHLDEAAARPVAELLAAELNQAVACVAGLHIENADAGDINTLIENAAAAGRSLLAQIRVAEQPETD